MEWQWMVWSHKTVFVVLGHGHTGLRPVPLALYNAQAPVFACVTDTARAREEGHDMICVYIAVQRASNVHNGHRQCTSRGLMRTLCVRVSHEPFTWRAHGLARSVRQSKRQ